MIGWISIGISTLACVIATFALFGTLTLYARAGRKARERLDNEVAAAVREDARRRRNEL